MVSQEEIDRQKSINEELWTSPENWGGPRWLCLYFCKKDPRIIVPKPIRSLGWTVNVAHTKGVLLLFGAFLLPVLILLAEIFINASLNAGR